MKAYRTLVDQGLAKLLQGMEDPLAAYVSTRMMLRVESETFTTMVAERDRAAWEASQCKVNPLREAYAAWEQLTGDARAGAPEQPCLRFVWGPPTLAPQYGPEVHESEVNLVDGEGRAVPYGAQGRTTWRSVDYKDKVPVVGRLLQWLRVEDL